ncbi:hypothetical protein FSP39_021676 [Pinctada imbricata]|uniref:Vasohibin-like protein n=1 Tax=Pinctada imbricata TaxID=66713 RepID=A0AA88XXW3_PINIB|nr:hypothetical protein FSP39_021676 [Pinctada imbricata]
MSKAKSAKERLGQFGTLVRVPDPDDEKAPGCIRIQTVKKNKNEEDVHEENGVLFWVNKSGFPIDNRTWDRMWDHVSKIHPAGLEMTHKIRNKSDLPTIPVPQAPTNFSASVSVPERLDRIQNYMRTLHLLESAKEMIKESLPIKCLEAVILGIYLSNGFLGLERFTVSFKSVFGGNVHRHVVLGVYYAGSWGTIGMSRREDLMYKSMTFKSLPELVFDFEKSYNKYMHDLKKVKIGMPIPHDPHSYEFINWKAVTVTPGKQSQKEMTKDLDTIAKEIRSRAKSWFNPSSPRKTISTMDSRDSLATNSLKQATKIYRAYTSIQSDSSTKKKNQTSNVDNTDYQLRI